MNIFQLLSMSRTEWHTSTPGESASKLGLAVLPIRCNPLSAANVHSLFAFQKYSSQRSQAVEYFVDVGP